MSNKAPSTGKIEKRFFFHSENRKRFHIIDITPEKFEKEGNNNFGFVSERKLGQGNA